MPTILERMENWMKFEKIVDIRMKMKYETFGKCLKYFATNPFSLLTFIEDNMLRTLFTGLCKQIEDIFHRALAFR